MTSFKVKNSLLLLTQTISELRQNVKPLLEESFKHTNKNLFIYFNPLDAKRNILEPTQLEDRYQLKLLINQFYQNSSKLNPDVNITCLLHNVHSIKSNFKLNLDYDLILTDLLNNSDEKFFQFCEANVPTLKLEQTPVHSILCQKNSINLDKPCSNKNDLINAGLIYRNSIMGGTFDRLHVGHKIMLSEAVLLTTKRLLIGLTTESMLKSKKLCELIQDYEVRKEYLLTFLKQISPDLEIIIAPLVDPFGPSIVEEDYQVN